MAWRAFERLLLQRLDALQSRDWPALILLLLARAWASFLSFWKSDVPSLLNLLAKTLSKAKIPASLAQARRFTMGDWLDAAPVLAGIFACVVTPLALLLLGQSRGGGGLKKETPQTETVVKKGSRSSKRQEDTAEDTDLSDSYWLTREALLSGMGLCYFCGFLVSALQHRALWGSLGLSPLTRRREGRPTPAFDFLEELGWGFGDWQLELVSWLGVVFSFQLMIGHFRSALVPAVCWVLYLSIVNLQAPFTYSYGWEWLTCEVGFLMIFLSPIAARGLASWTPPPRLVLWLIRWCAFRLLLGAGMSKVGRNSSACWRQLTCTQTHYFTQPVPNPLSWYMHHLPDDLHRVEVALTFVEQLVLPFFMLIPVRGSRVLAGLLEICFQMGIVGTGNYAWINFIGALPCLALLDDGVFSWICRRRATHEVSRARKEAAVGSKGLLSAGCRWIYGKVRFIAHLALFAVMIYKSRDPIKELFGPAPWINNYDQWFLMNSQGVFGFINEHRVQVVLRYTHDEHMKQWQPLDFKCLPGNTSRRPCFMSPYHYRLDWETWIRVTASLEQLWEQRAPAQAYHERLPDFLQSLIVRILSGDDDAAGLVGVPIGELYKGGEPPKAVSVGFASYTFTGKKEKGEWWREEQIGEPWAYGGQGNKLPQQQVRKSPRQRHWILGLCAVGMGLMAEHAVLNGAWRLVEAVLGVVLLGHLFTVVLASDYEELWQEVTPWMVPPNVPACLQKGVAAQQRCCYEYVRRCSSGYSILALLWALSTYSRRTRNDLQQSTYKLLPFFICCLLPPVVLLSQQALE